MIYEDRSEAERRPEVDTTSLVGMSVCLAGIAAVLAAGIDMSTHTQTPMRIPAGVRVHEDGLDKVIDVKSEAQAKIIYCGDNKSLIGLIYAHPKKSAYKDANGIHIKCSPGINAVKVQLPN